MRLIQLKKVLETHIRVCNPTLDTSRPSASAAAFASRRLVSYRRKQCQRFLNLPGAVGAERRASIRLEILCSGGTVIVRRYNIQQKVVVESSKGLPMALL